MWDSMEVSLAFCRSSLLSWLQANIQEQLCSPSSLMLPVWIQCVLWLARAASLTHRNCPGGGQSLRVLACFVRVPCPLTESSFWSAGEQQINSAAALAYCPLGGAAYVFCFQQQHSCCVRWVLRASELWWDALPGYLSMFKENCCFLSTSGGEGKRT